MFSERWDTAGAVFDRARCLQTPQDQSAEGIVDHVILTLHIVEILDNKDAVDSIVSFCWHTLDQNTFAVAAKNAVHVCKLDKLVDAAGLSPLDFSLHVRKALPSSPYLYLSLNTSPTALHFSCLDACDSSRDGTSFIAHILGSSIAHRVGVISRFVTLHRQHWSVMVICYIRHLV